MTNSTTVYQRDVANHIVLPSRGFTNNVNLAKVAHFGPCAPLNYSVWIRPPFKTNSTTVYRRDAASHIALPSRGFANNVNFVTIEQKLH